MNEFSKKILKIIEVTSICGIIVLLIAPNSPFFNNNIYLLTMMVLIWLLSVLCLYHTQVISTYLSYTSCWRFLWLLLSLCYCLIDYDDYHMSWLLYFFVFSIGVFYLKLGNLKICKIICVVALSLLTITTVGTLKVYSDVPMLSRILARGAIHEVENYENLPLFLASYDTVCGLVFIVLILYSILDRKHKLIRNIGLILVGCYTLLIVKSQFFIAAVLLMLGIIIYIVERKKMRWMYLFLCLMVPVIIVLVPPLLQYLGSQGIGGVSVAVRFREIGNILLTGSLEYGTDINERADVYLLSINTFLDNPFLGIGKDVALLGRHSTLFDMVGHYGLIGGTALMVFYIMPIYDIYKLSCERDKCILKVLYFILFIMMIVNPVTTKTNYGVIYILVPLILHCKNCYVDKEKERDTHVFKIDVYNE